MFSCRVGSFGGVDEFLQRVGHGRNIVQSCCGCHVILGPG
jgi:hypothetical protein